jgi:hypothetical protein
MPSEGVPGWAAKANVPTGSSQSVPAVSTTRPNQSVAPVPTRPTETEETKPTAAISDATEPLKLDDTPSVKVKKKRSSSIGSDVPVAAARPPAKPKEVVPEAAPEPKPAPAPSPSVESDDDEYEATDFGMVMALSALALFGVACLATLFPYGRFIAGAFAGLGLLGGLGTLGAEGRARLAGGAAIALHGLLLLLILLLPSWLNLDPWIPEIPDTPPAPQAFSHKKQSATLAQWVDSATASWQFQDVRVTIHSATVGPIELLDPKGVKRPSKEQYLQLIVRVANIGVARPLDLSGWTVGNNLELVKVIDSAGREIKPASFEEDWSPLPFSSEKPPEKLYPDHPYELRLLFNAPQPRIDFIRVALPATMFGFEEEVKFQIESGSLILTGPKRK